MGKRGKPSERQDKKKTSKARLSKLNPTGNARRRKRDEERSVGLDST